MEEGCIDKHDLNRIITAVEHDMIIEPLEKPRLVVKDVDTEGNEGHVVQFEKLECTCEDYTCNCNNDQYCKHIYRTVFAKHNML